MDGRTRRMRSTRLQGQGPKQECAVTFLAYGRKGKPAGSPVVVGFAARGDLPIE
jgi:hypothetical protein